MVVTLGLDVCVGHKEHGEDDDDNIPSGQNQTWGNVLEGVEGVERRATVPESLRDGAHLIWSVPGGESHHSRDLKQTNLESVRRTDFHTVETLVSNVKHYSWVSHLRAMFPFRANEIAFMNSVVFGTRANRVIPRNFSSIPDPSSTTSTTPTSNSVRSDL